MCLNPLLVIPLQFTLRTSHKLNVSDIESVGMRLNSSAAAHVVPNNHANVADELSTNALAELHWTPHFWLVAFRQTGSCPARLCRPAIQRERHV